MKIHLLIHFEISSLITDLAFFFPHFMNASISS